MNIKRCLICGESDFDCIHRGTRDDPKINVLQCTRCGGVQLDIQTRNTEVNYASGEMLRDEYCADQDAVLDIDWETWTKETAKDDERRYRALADLCTGKNVLDFGCGNGGFLKRIKRVAASVAGIELMDEARKRLNEDGIPVYSKLSEIETGLRQYDVVCMFHVIEHLNDPDQILQSVLKKMDAGGVLVCETCNANDALLSKYKCSAFADFTYWSEHVFLFHSESLEALIARNGFQTICNKQIQRYSLANHLHWLSSGKPGGHEKWKEFNHQELNRIYAEILAEQKIADTLWYIGKKTKE